MKNLATTGALSVAALGLIGVGAHAIFTTSSTSSQTVTAGTLTVVLSSPDASNGCLTPAIAAANPGTCQTLVLNSVGPVGSTFDTTPSTVTVSNVGNITASAVSTDISDTNTNATMQSEMDMCYSGGAKYASSLALWESHSPIPVSPPVSLAPGGSNTYAIDFFAGQDSSVCGSGHYVFGATTPASLTQAAEGGSVTVSFTITDNG